MTTRVQCCCGKAEIELTGEPLVQFYCHCDCQAVHGAAYVPKSVYPSDGPQIGGRQKMSTLWRAHARALSIRSDNFVAHAGDLEVFAVLRSDRGLRHHFLSAETACEFVRRLGPQHHIDRGASIAIGRRGRGCAR